MGWEIMPEDARCTNQACEICGEPVKAGQKFYFGNKAGVAHAHCVWGKEEKPVKKE